MLLTYPKVAASISGGGAETLVTTHTLIEDGGNTLGAFYYQFGQGFKRGYIPTGSIPVLRRATDSVAVPFQMDNISRWDDGSLRHAVFATWQADGISASTEKTIDIYKTSGSYSQSAARTLSDVTGEDFKVKITAATNQSDSAIGSGSFTWTANDYSASVRQYATGDLRNGFELVGSLKDDTGGAADTHMWARGIFEVVSDPDGNLHDIKHCITFGLPKLYTSSKRGLRCKAALYNGATLIRDYAEVITFATTDVNTTNNTVTITNHGLIAQQACRITSSGTVPGGLTSGQLVYISPVDANTISFATNTFNARGGGNVDLSSQGTGTHTLTVYIEMPYWAGVPTLDTDADMFWLNDNKPSVRPKWSDTERDYWAATGLIPPYSFDATTPDASVSTVVFTNSYMSNDFKPMTGQFWRVNVNGTGPGDIIGPQPKWVAAWVFNQDKIGFKNIKTGAPVIFHAMQGFVIGDDNGGLYCGNTGPLRDSTTPYDNMADPTPSTYYFSSINKSADIPVAPTGIGGDSSVNGIFSESTGPDGSHWPSCAYMAYLVTGERHFERAGWANANRHAFAAGDMGARYETANGNDYFVPLIYNQLRGGGWIEREFALWGAVGEDSGERAYFADCYKDYCDYFDDLATEIGGNFVTTGWYTRLTTYAGDGDNFAREVDWQRFITAFTAFWGKALHRDFSDAPATQAYNWVKNFADEAIVPYYYAGWDGDYFRRKSFQNTTDEPAPSEVIMRYGTFSVATDGTFTLTDGVLGVSSGITNDDVVVFVGDTKPAEFSYTSQYRVVNKSGSTFKLSATSGGSAITSAAGASGVLIGVIGPQNPQTGIYDGNPAGHSMQFVMAMAWAKAAGYTGMDAALTENISRQTTAGINIASDQTYLARGDVVIV